jgi:group I intron endonuclease
MTCGIYRVVNRINGKYYLGSSENIKKRWKAHRCDLRHNRHHSIHLQRAWNKYGEESFVFEIVEEVNKNILLEKEQYHLDTYTPWNIKVGYNMSKSASGGDLTSYHPNIDEIKEKQRVATQRRWDMKTEEEKLKYAESFKGDSNPNWQGGKSYFKCPICECAIKKHNKNQLCCAKCRDRTGSNNPFYGKKHNEKTRMKMRKYRLRYGSSLCVTKIKVEIDGVIYSSFSEAAKKLDCAVASIRNRLNNPTKFPNYKLITQP